MIDLSRLDNPELLHLALEAARRDDHGTAITYLKQAIDLPDGKALPSADYAKLLYLLGAEYAQIGVMARAIDYMGQAIDVDPAMHTARFQLGLLHLTCAQPEQGLAVLTPLADLGPESMFYHLHQGLAHLVRDEFELCRGSLRKGMELNKSSSQFNQALNGDMQKLLDALPGGDVTPPTAVPGGNDMAEAEFMMSAYSRGQNAN